MTVQTPLPEDDDLDDGDLDPREVPAEMTPFPVWVRLVLGNSFVLSLLYLGTGLGAELLRHAYPVRTLSRVLQTLERTPARVLELVGLMAPLQQAYLRGEVSKFWVHWLFGFTMMAIIFFTAALMAALMATAQWLWVRRSGPGRTRES